MSYPFANNFYHPYYPSPEPINYYYPWNFPSRDQAGNFYSDPCMMHPGMLNYAVQHQKPQYQNKIDPLSVKGTTDYERPQELKQMQKPLQLLIKEEEQPSKSKQPYILAKNQQNSEVQKAKIRKPKLKKNTEANVVNNILSYLSLEVKSHYVIKKLLVQKEKMKIFYIFMNNLKKMNNKYLNKKILEQLLLLQQGSPYEKMLQKSIKRLQVLPLAELRDVIRKSVFSYLRGPNSLYPLFTSKKICRISLKQHLEKRRHMADYLMEVLKRDSCKNHL